MSQEGCTALFTGCSCSGLLGQNFGRIQSLVPPFSLLVFAVSVLQLLLLLLLLLPC